MFIAPYPGWDTLNCNLLCIGSYLMWTAFGNPCLELFWPSTSCSVRCAAVDEVSNWSVLIIMTKHVFEMMLTQRRKLNCPVYLFCEITSTPWICLNFAINAMICVKRDTVFKKYFTSISVRCFNRNFKRASETKLRWWLNVLYLLMPTTVGLGMWKTCQRTNFDAVINIWVR